MSIEIINDKRLWDDFVDSSLNGTLFHKWDFLNIIEYHSGMKLVRYAIYKGDEMLALFPIYIGKKTILNMVMSPPFSYVPYLGPIIKFGYAGLKQDKKELIINSIVEEFSNEARICSSDYIMIRTTPGFSDIRPFKWEGYEVDPYYTYIIDLNPKLDEIWMTFKKSCRKNISSLEGKVVIKKSRDISVLSDLTKSRFENQNINAPVGISYSYLVDITEKFKDNLDIYYLYDESSVSIITGLLIAKYNDHYLIWIGNVRADLQGANEYLLWKLVKIAKAEGYKSFEIFGANTKRLCQFKSKFNPTLNMGFTISKRSCLGYLGEQFYLKLLLRGII